MAKRTLTSDLSIQGIKKLQQDLKKFEQEINRKNVIFVRRLAELGIQVSQQNVGNFGNYIAFRKEIKDNKTNCQAIMIAYNTGHIINQWQSYGEIKTAKVNPLLMAEFGSGSNANNPMKVPGVGQGTFPNQTHAFDTNGWYWLDLNGEWHHSNGIKPSQPLYKAVKEIKLNVKSVAKQVFGN